MKRILLHGTDVQTAKTIKQNGFVIDSMPFPENNYFGKGVYLTDDKEIAVYFATKAMLFNKQTKIEILYVEVNVKRTLFVRTINELTLLENKVESIQLFSELRNNKVRAYLIAEGYDSVDATGAWDVIGVDVFDPKNVIVLN